MEKTNKKIIAIFDFCDTLVSGQTVSMFLKFLNKKEKNLFKKIYIRIKNRFSILKKDNSLRYKNYLLGSFKGEGLEYMNEVAEEFVSDVLLKSENKKIIESLKWHQKNGHDVVIVSNAFDIYLNKYARIYDVKCAVSTKLKFNSQKRFCGMIDGEECSGINKIKFIKEVIDLDGYNMQESFAYSDSVQDKPILSLVGNVFIIRKDKNRPEWIEKNWKLIDVSDEVV